MATAMEERLEGALRFFSLKDMEQRGVMLEAGALHAVASEAWADIREGRAYAVKSVLLPPESELSARPELNHYRTRRAARVEAVHALECWAGLRSRQDRRRQRTQSLSGTPQVDVYDRPLRQGDARTGLPVGWNRDFCRENRNLRDDDG